MRSVLPLLVAVGAACALLPAAAPALPSLVIEPASVDLGIVEGDETVSFQVLLRNEGDATLVIDEVSTSCGCTVAFLPDSILDAGESVLMSGDFATRKMEGEVRKAIFLSTNDPYRARAVIMVRIWVQRTLTLSTSTVNFSNADPEGGTERKVLLRPGSNVDFEILGITGDSDQVEWEVLPGEREGDRIIRFTSKPLPRGTDIAGAVEIRTTVKGKEKIILRLFGKVREHG
jgi:hypothetical protein